MLAVNSFMTVIISSESSCLAEINHVMRVRTRGMHLQLPSLVEGFLLLVCERALEKDGRIRRPKFADDAL